MKQHRSIIIGCALCVLMVALGSCSNNSHKELTEEGVMSAESWLQMVDAGQYEESWDESSEVFKSAVSRAGWGQSLNSVRMPLGDLVSREVKSAQYATSLPGAPDGEYVVVQFTTVFSHKKSAIETVTPMKDPDGVWRISGYYIR